MTPGQRNASPHPAAPGPHLNALKHGLRSQTLLLPGEDGAEFQRMRLELYERHRPGTGNEARCVEAIANHEWVMERCRRVRDAYHAKMLAVLGGEAQHCEADPHRWHHKALDCTLEEGRLQRHQERERRKLVELQKLRKQRLLAALEAGDREEVLPGRDARPTEQDMGGGDAAAASEAVEGSKDGENGESCKREPAAPSRKARRRAERERMRAAKAAARRMRRMEQPDGDFRYLDFGTPAA